MTSAVGRLRRAVLIVTTVIAAGTLGYWLLGLGFLDALYQTVTTITTVGFRELGVGGLEAPTVVGDATLDATLRDAGIERAGALVATLAGDAANLFVTLSARAIKPSLFIVARAREEGSVAKLAQAGADRVVNPQELGAARMASFVVQPNVAEFVDVVMHERSLEFRMHEVELPSGSALDGRTLREVDLRRRANVLVLALRRPDGSFLTNPDPDTRLEAHQVLIAVGTDVDLARLADACR